MRGRALVLLVATAAVTLLPPAASAGASRCHVMARVPIVSADGFGWVVGRAQGTRSCFVGRFVYVRFTLRAKDRGPPPFTVPCTLHRRQRFVRCVSKGSRCDSLLRYRSKFRSYNQSAILDRDSSDWIRVCPNG